MSEKLSISERAMAGLAGAGAPSPVPYLDALNDEQRAAVEAMEGPVLVLAGAGTGKTRALTTRLAHLIFTGRARPWQILAVTFTNKAAREMKERVGALIGDRVEGMQWLGTFHSIGAQILRRHAELAGLKSSFTILDADDQARLAKQVIDAAGLDDKRWTGRNLAVVIDGWKNRGLTPDKVPANESWSFADGKAIELYAAYQARLKTLNAADFGDLLVHNLTIFQKHPDVLADYQERFRYMLVDEYQDTNVAQYLWLRLLAQKHKNICCVGDDDQCLAEGSLVTMADGLRRPIEQIRAGDLVLSSYGSGDFRPARVADVFAKRRRGELIRLTTAAGRTLTSTPEHVHFAGYRLGITPQTYFVYLMKKECVGFRLGTSQVYTRGQKKPVIGFEQRLRQEHGDALWVIAAHGSENEARAQEYELSLRYAIPTLPFTPRKGASGNGLVHDEAYLKRIFDAFDTAASAERLLADAGLSIDAPHHRPRSRNSNRRNVVVTLCGDRRGRTPMHRISIVGNDETGRVALSAAGLSIRPAKAGSASWRFETANADFGAVAATVDAIAETMPINVFRVAQLGAQQSETLETNSLPFTPAAFLRPGMALFDESGGYDVVTKIERFEADGDVYDLNIERTHNFIANSIVTHNSIYGWRGAEVENILRFEKDFPGAKVIRLERNYRSTPPILAAASGLIDANKERLGKTLWTDRTEGENVKVRGVWDGEEEARLIGDDIEAEQHKGRALDDMAVLVRASFQMRAFEERFNTLGVPYRVVGGPRFYEREETRDALAYLRLIRSADDDLSFERIVNKPRRGLGDKAIAALHTIARAKGVSLYAASRIAIETDELTTAAKKSLASFIGALDRWSRDARDMPPADIAELALEESGYIDMWKTSKSAQADGKIDNLKELVQAASEFDTLEAYLDHVALVSDLSESSEGGQVWLMTLHAAKGLEFPVVFLPGWEEGIFPSQRALDEKGAVALEEERRLAYVGITRAEESCRISFAANRQIYGRWQAATPSRFIDELPEEAVDVVSQPGLYGAAASNFASHSSFDGAKLKEDAYYDNPGWRRARAASARPAAAPLIEGRAQTVSVSAPGKAKFPIGARVFHQKFGYGKVIGAEGQKLTVHFDHSGPKKVIDTFLDAA